MKISIITVCFNSSKTIRDTIESVISQSYKNIEYIVVDGGSTDKTLEILENYKNNINVLISEKDEGIYDAMNKGLSLATGQVVGFLNSDDFYADTSVLEQISTVFLDDQIDACFADLLYVSQDNKSIIRYWKSKNFCKGDFALGWSPAHPTLYLRKSVIDRCGNFDKTYKIAADVEFMMRCFEVGNIRAVYIPRIWVRMRIGGKTNESMRNIIQQNGEVLRGLRKNNIKYSFLLFVVRKIANRAWQFASGKIRRNH